MVTLKEKARRIVERSNTSKNEEEKRSVVVPSARGASPISIGSSAALLLT